MLSHQKKKSRKKRYEKNCNKHCFYMFALWQRSESSNELGENIFSGANVHGNSQAICVDSPHPFVLDFQSLSLSVCLLWMFWCSISSEFAQIYRFALAGFNINKQALAIVNVYSKGGCTAATVVGGSSAFFIYIFWYSQRYRSVVISLCHPPQLLTPVKFNTQRCDQRNYINKITPNLSLAAFVAFPSSHRRICVTSERKRRKKTNSIPPHYLSPKQRSYAKEKCKFLSDQWLYGRILCNETSSTPLCLPAALFFDGCSRLRLTNFSSPRRSHEACWGTFERLRSIQLVQREIIVSRLRPLFHSDLNSAVYKKHAELHEGGRLIIKQIISFFIPVCCWPSSSGEKLETSEGWKQKGGRAKKMENKWEKNKIKLAVLGCGWMAKFSSHRLGAVFSSFLCVLFLPLYHNFCSFLCSSSPLRMIRLLSWCRRSKLEFFHSSFFFFLCFFIIVFAFYLAVCPKVRRRDFTSDSDAIKRSVVPLS